MELSNREIQVLKATSAGMSAKEVADKLNLSVRTVETYRYNILQKTGCKTIFEVLILLGALDLSKIINEGLETAA